MKFRIARLLVFILFISTNSNGQQQRRTIVEFVGSAYVNSSRLYYDNGNESIYGEGRVGVRINKYFEATAAVGYQERSFIYFAQVGSNLVPLFMDRHYVPAGVNLRLYLSQFFFEKLKLWRKLEKWDVYNQVGLARLFGHDVRDPREEDFRTQGANVPYYVAPYVESYGKIYVTYLVGVRYNFNDNLGIFFEGGEGMIATLQIGLSVRF